MHSQTFYKNRDNFVRWQLLKQKVAINHTVITRAIIKMDDTAAIDIDSQSQPGVFNFANPDYIDIYPRTIMAPDGNYEAALIIYDPTNPNGLLWQEGIVIKVKG